MDIRRTILARVTLVLAVLMAACAATTEDGPPSEDQPPAQGHPVAGTEWVLVSLNGNAPIEGKTITLRFGDSSIEGSGGCNTYWGSYAATQDGLSLSDVYRTEIGCMEPAGIMEQEQAYFEALDAVARYRVAQNQGSGERLELYDENSAQILEFVAAGTANPRQSNALSGTEWTLVSLNGSAPIEGRKVTLSFREAAIEGSGGCNTYGGNYTASEGSLSLSGVYATEMACMDPEGIMEQERAYLDALGAAARYQIEDDRLELYDASGTLILAFATPASGEDIPTRTVSVFPLGCTLEMDETYPVGESVTLRFALHNPTDRPLYVLNWYTPLEGMAGDIFEVTQDGKELPYQGMLAKRGDPTREAYVAIESGAAASAQVDLTTGYDLSAPGSYQVQFAAGLQDVTEDVSSVPQKRDGHRPQSLSCSTARFRIVPAPELPTATPTPTDVPPTATPLAAATPTPEPPAGFRRYVNGPSGVSLWVPESWTIIEPGPHWPILQSYPQDKYVGGEARQPGDSKCDLAIHPPGTSVADVVPQNRSDPPVTIVSEGEIALRSGRTGKRFEVESMGRSLSLVAEVNERVVVLTCFGELAPFDEIAVTLGAGE